MGFLKMKDYTEHKDSHFVVAWSTKTVQFLVVI